MLGFRHNSKHCYVEKGPATIPLCRHWLSTGVTHPLLSSKSALWPGILNSQPSVSGPPSTDLFPSPRQKGASRWEHTYFPLLNLQTHLHLHPTSLPNPTLCLPCAFLQLLDPSVLWVPPWPAFLRASLNDILFLFYFQPPLIYSLLFSLKYLPY